MAAEQRDLIVHRIAAELDLPSLYMGGPSNGSKRKAGRIVDLLPAALRDAGVTERTVEEITFVLAEEA